MSSCHANPFFIILDLMPNVIRIPIRMDCSGINLSVPVDRMPPGSFPLLSNVRVIEEGRIEGRPGYSLYDNSASAPKLLHTVRRLNDPDQSFAPGGYTNVVGNGTIIEAGPEGTLTQIDTGYSGDPLSLITFRPEQSPESWMYAYDKNKQVKVRPDGVTRPIGFAPPTSAPLIEYGAPAQADILSGQSSSGWAVTSPATVATADRTQGGVTISTIIYNSGTPGWCCMVPSANTSAWAGARMAIVLNFGAGNQEYSVVREINPAIVTSFIDGIQYDSGNSGLCSIVLDGLPAQLNRNSLIQINDGVNTEIIRVLEVILSPDGNANSIRCSTVNTFAAGSGSVVTGMVSWYVYTDLVHSAGETITSNYIAVTSTIVGTTELAAKIIGTENGSLTNLGRPIDPANDYYHISVFLQNPGNVVSLVIQVDIDPGTVAGTPFTTNFWQWTVTQAQLGNFGPASASVWVDLVLPISTGQRIGNDLSLNFSVIYALSFALITTAACSFGIDWFYFFGTYGPVIQPNSPAGYLYQSVNRDSTTGAESVPGPQTRYDLFPLRESIIVTPQATNAVGVDSLDIYKQGGTLTGFVLDATVANNFISPDSFRDGIPDTSLLASPAPDLTKIQPWPLLGLPWSGVVNVVGTSVEWVSGVQFNTALLSATIILINGVVYQTYGQPRSATFLELFTDAGVQNNASYLIASPTLAGQPLPYAFGPLEGPLAPVVFGLGDLVSGGNFYWTNFSDGDSADDANFLELTPPSEPLISGQVWNGIVICGSRDNIFLVRYSFVTNSVYQFNRIPSPSGMWTRWASCRGPDGVYFLGRDGIYLATEAGAKNITDGQLYPLFPHDGAPAVGSPSLAAVDMTQVGKFMRLSAGMFEVFFDYLDVSGTQRTLRFDIPKQRWFPHVYGDAVLSHYLIDESVTAPATPQILLLGAASGNIYSVGGNDDAGVAIVSQAQVPYQDGGDFRTQKLNTDYIVDSDGVGIVDATQYYDNGVSNGPTIDFTVSGPRIQSILNISNVSNILTLYRNTSVLLSWTGGPAGPRIYGIQLAWYSQPYLSTRVITQFINLDSPGTWLHLRRLYAGLISTSPVNFTVTTQDGRTYSVVIPSTNGRFFVSPIMTPQGCKSLAMAFELDSNGIPFALFPEAFTPEVKFWQEPSFINLAVFLA